MTQTTLALPAVTIGIDVGDKKSHFHCLDESGGTVEVGRLPTNPSSFRRKFEALPACRIAFEAGSQSRWIERLLRELGHEVLVANPRKVRSIFESDRKSDDLDAEQLARLARVDPRLLRPVQQRSRQAQRDRAVLVARDALVRARARLVNCCRGMLKSEGLSVASCSTPAFARKVRDAVPEALRPALGPLLDEVDQLSAHIRAYDRHIEALCEQRYPVTKILRQVGGIGPITALAFVVTLEDPRRFSNSRKAGVFVGLTPRRDQSGDCDPELPITKAGDPMLRRLLVQSAHYLLGRFGKDCDLQRFGQRLAQRGGKNAKKRAIVAVARKLAVLLHALWKTGAVYEPLRHHPALPSTA